MTSFRSIASGLRASLSATSASPDATTPNVATTARSSPPEGLVARETPGAAGPAPRPRNKLKKPAPATAVTAEPTPPAWFARPAEVRDVQVRRSAVETVDGRGFALVDGQMLAWCATSGAWEKASLPSMNALRLGGDGQPHALTEYGRVVRLAVDEHGTVSPKATAHAVPPGTAAWAMSAGGSLVTTAPGGTTLQWHHDTNAATELPLPARAGKPVSVAFHNDGTLHVLDEHGAAWHGRPLEVAKEGAVAWHPTEARAGLRLDNLCTQADGTVGGLNAAGARWSPDPRGKWQAVADRPGRLLDALYTERFREGPTNTAHSTVGGFVPGAEDLRVKDKPFWKPGMFHRNVEGERLTERWGNWVQAHHTAQFHPGEQLRRDLAHDLGRLPAADDTRPMLLDSRANAGRLDEARRKAHGHVQREVAAKVDANAMLALDRLEQALGLRLPDGRANPHARMDPAFLKHHVSDGRAHAESNVLVRLRDYRAALYDGVPAPQTRGAASPEEAARVAQSRDLLANAHRITSRLDALIDQGVYLPVSSRYLFKNDVDALTGKLVHDHAVLHDAMAEISTSAAVGAAHHDAADVLTERAVSASRRHAARVDGGDDNLISKLFANDVTRLREHTHADPVKRLDAELESDWRALATPAPRVPPGALQGVSDKVNDNTRDVISRLEQALAVHDAQHGKPAPAPGDRPRFKDRLRNMASSSPRDDDVLRRVIAQREALVPADDQAGRAITEQLRALAARTHLAWGHGHLGVLAGKLVHDHAVWAGAVRSAEPATTAVARLDAGNEVSNLFRQQLVDLKQARVSLAAMQSVGIGLNDPRHRMNRALRLGGAIGQERPDQLYPRLVQEMRPGESIELKASRGLGLSADGLSHVFRPSDRGTDGEKVGALTLRLNVVPNVQPAPSISHRHEQEFTLTKTSDGISLSFGKSSEWEIKPLAAKITWGAGMVAARPEIGVVGVGFLGWEVVPGVTLSVKEDNTVAMDIRQDDQGQVQHVLAQLFNGAITPGELLAKATDIATKRTQSRSVQGTIDWQGAVSGVFVLGPDRDPATIGDDRMKAVAASAVQLSSHMKLTQGHARTHEPEGFTTTRIDELDGAVTAKAVQAFELQSSHVERTPNLHNPDGVRPGDGYEMENKVPVRVWVQEKTVFGKSLVTDGFAMAHDAAGTLVGVTTKLHTVTHPSSNAVLRYLDRRHASRAFSEANVPPLRRLLAELPELRAHVDKISLSGKPVDAKMELTPAALRLLQDTPPAGREALAKALVNDASNLRITEVQVRGTHTYTTSSTAAISALRVQSAAENSFRSDHATVRINYPKEAGARPVALVSGDLLVGAHQRPDISQLEHGTRDGAAHLAHLLDPFAGAGGEVRADVARAGARGERPYVLDVMAAVRSTAGQAMPALDAESHAVLRAFFPGQAAGEIDRMALGRLLGDAAQLKLFEAAVERVSHRNAARDGAFKPPAPSVLRRGLPPGPARNGPAPLLATDLAARLQQEDSKGRPQA